MSSQIVLVQESGDTANYPFPSLLLEVTYFYGSPSTDREVIPLLSCSENKALLCQTETTLDLTRNANTSPPSPPVLYLPLPPLGLEATWVSILEDISC